MTNVDYRAKLEELMVETLEDQQRRHLWRYHAVRPMYVPAGWGPGQPVIGDCSKGVQYLCKWAKVPNDPMNMGWGPYGNSQTLWAHLQHLGHPSELFVGDIVTFGYDGNEHAAMVKQAGNDPLMWSFGHQGAPNEYHLSWDRRQHQYLRLFLPDYVPTPDDKLRAKTGYFAWMQWNLGEGDWKKKGRTNQSVRPDVPKIIPVDWWKRRFIFLTNRKKGNPIGSSI